MATRTVAKSRRRPRVEAPTLILTFAIYGGWIAATLGWRLVPWPVLAALGGWLVAWHSSLQHEVIHGHPTRSRRLNNAIGWPPLSLWLPYAVYRRTHLRHHADEHLTDPIDDPESAYVTPERWDRMGPVGRTLLRFNATLLGRLVLGPLIMIAAFLVSEAVRICHGDRDAIRVWMLHGIGVVAVLVWVSVVCGMPIWLYLVAFVYPGAALMRLRAFAEHRWSNETSHRTAIVEGPGPLGLLFLNNNLHALHHEKPNIAWYRLPAHYAAERGSLTARNGGLLYGGYGDIARKFFFRTHDDPVHPARRGSGGAGP